jgi:hypothetical protein
MWPALAFAVLAGASLAAGGCGDGERRSEPRPPAPINLTASISSRGVAVSPTSVGAGPIVLIVTNQTPTSQEVTFESDTLRATQGGVAQTTEPINPRGTGQLMVDVSQGSYRVRAGNPDIEPATVTVGPRRQSAQNQVLQP